MRHTPAPNPRLQLLRDGNPTTKRPAYVAQPSDLLLLWENGEGDVFPYHSFVNARFRHGDELNVLKLKFLSDTVILRGYQLEVLLLQFSHIKPSLIQVQNPRYSGINNKDGYMVVEATIESDHTVSKTLSRT